MRYFVDSLYDRDHAGFRRMMDGIGSGDSLWLEVAREIRWSGNSELGESLVDVLGTEALLRAPRLVLRLAMDSTTFGPKICTPSFYEGDADSLVARVTTDARQALISVTEPELRELRDQCLSYLP